SAASPPLCSPGTPPASSGRPWRAWGHQEDLHSCEAEAPPGMRKPHEVVSDLATALEDFAVRRGSDEVREGHFPSGAAARWLARPPNRHPERRPAPRWCRRRGGCSRPPGGGAAARESSPWAFILPNR